MVVVVTDMQSPRASSSLLQHTPESSQYLDSFPWVSSHLMNSIMLFRHTGRLPHSS